MSVVSLTLRLSITPSEDGETIVATYAAKTSTGRVGGNLLDDFPKKKTSVRRLLRDLVKLVEE